MNRLMLFAPLLLSVACAGFEVHPVQPSAEGSVAEVQVQLDPALGEDRREALVDYDAVRHMREALRGSLAAGEGPALRVTITEFRNGSFGPTRMRARADLVAPDGAVLRSVEADSTTMRGGTTKKARRVAQDVVEQIVRQI
ncbi:MAG TPA: hypothetical protein RMH85_26685 [Polyangiaceae bacterium LLY-WYZ-15_(1-7)]|nr:hypothetical protein [Polyangiaceae bacterium LLY-WYZ-15_(1-7)]HJL01066.1 hypothetical protein [Polyangiaceae bacterium LLY-WYZ-15_(1-7)]HJL12092.1 hypothetical protein [Polyangiaceae bacterium LLY-WYZ-15_(1-7)]HJL21248.1 hypothetical protein [Polyangiaceae bacterium LLY-WYZ-15_(1-7)]HJL29405.1 hypothetical protein [Polyangiaceae bacterium LLY-WYZ-15_(1-7)]